MLINKLYRLYQRDDLPLDIWFKVSNTLCKELKNAKTFNWDFLDAGFNDPSRKQRHKRDRLRNHMAKRAKARRY